MEQLYFTINGKTMLKYTNENGSAFMNIGLKTGIYNVSR